jgi:hypothetical protein
MKELLRMAAVMVDADEDGIEGDREKFISMDWGAAPDLIRMRTEKIVCWSMAWNCDRCGDW